MKTILKNWKTSLLGSGALALAMHHYITYPNDVQGTLGLVMLGFLGLITKDGGSDPPADAQKQG